MVIGNHFLRINENNKITSGGQIARKITKNREVDRLEISGLSEVTCNLCPKILVIDSCQDLNMPNLGETKKLVISNSEISQKMWSQLRKIPEKHFLNVSNDYSEYILEAQKVTFSCWKHVYNSKMICEKVKKICISMPGVALNEEGLLSVVTGLFYNPGRYLQILATDRADVELLLNMLIVCEVSLEKLKIKMDYNQNMAKSIADKLLRINCRVMCLPGFRLCPKLFLEIGTFKELYVGSAYGNYKKNERIKFEIIG